MRIRTAILILILALPVPLAAGEWLAGAAGDSSRGYVWITREETFPRSPNTAIVASATASYLFYEAVDTAGTTDVTSPGVGAAVLYRWQYPRFSFAAGPGWDVRWTTRRGPGPVEERQLETGPTAQAGLVFQIAEPTTLVASASYSEPVDWTWSRAAVMQTLGARLRAGPEIAYHGNEDVRVTETGGAVEIGHIALRAGTARIRYASGREETKPYYSVGYVRRF